MPHVPLEVALPARLPLRGNFFLGCWLTLRGRSAGPVIVAVMCALEIAAFPGLKRTTTADWIVQIFIVVVSAVGIVAAAASLLERRRHAPAT